MTNQTMAGSPDNEEQTKLLKQTGLAPQHANAPPDDRSYVFIWVCKQDPLREFFF